jgi:hypothetical protein
MISTHIKIRGSVYAYDNLWQTPAKTEQHAYEMSAQRFPQQGTVIYVAFPWATLIDNLNTKSLGAGDLVEALNILVQRLPDSPGGRITVCQHIYALKYLELFQRSGITDIFIPHAEHSCRIIDGIRIHPFPLYPVKTATSEFCARRSTRDLLPRKFLYSFIGAHDSRYYRTESREHIFKLLDHVKGAEVFISRRGEWHYQKDVYDVQIKGESVSEEFRRQQKKNEDEYVNVLLASTFSLCPSGSGPNSIRLWESLGAGSIPVILADGLRLPGHDALWRESAVFVREEVGRIEAIGSQLLKLSRNPERLARMVSAGEQLYHLYGPGNFVEDVISLALDRMGSTSAASVKKVSDRNKVYIFDPGLKDGLTHHHILNDNVTKLLLHNGIEHRVFGNQKYQNPNSKYEVTPSFQNSPYDDIPTLSDRDFLRQCAGYARTIKDIFDIYGSASSLLIHTATPALIQGLAFAMRHFKCDFSLINLQLMFHPLSFDSKDQNQPSLAYTRYLIALRMLKKAASQNCNAGISVSTSCSSFSRLYSEMMQEEVRLHPYALYTRQISADMSAATPKLHINLPNCRKVLLFSGDLKLDKGIDWVADALPKLLDADKQSQFYVQLANVRFGSSALNNIVATLKQFALTHRRVTIIEHYIPPEDWINFLASMDVFFIPYNPRGYRYKTSGILCEYLQHAKSTANLIVSRNTWLCEEAAHWKLPLTGIEFGDSESLVSILRSIEKAPILGRLTETCPEFWHQYFGMGNDEYLVENLIS